MVNLHISMHEHSLIRGLNLRVTQQVEIDINGKGMTQQIFVLFISISNLEKYLYPENKKKTTSGQGKKN